MVKITGTSCFLCIFAIQKEVLLCVTLVKILKGGDTIMDIGAYCLMPNHFHFLVREKVDDGISLYMRKLLTAYAMYFNKKYKRTGRLYENVFKSNYVGKEGYLKYLYSYIHLNPAKLINKNWRDGKKRNSIKLLKYVFSYPHSSLHEYVDAKFKIVNPSNFPKYFTKLEDHRTELFGWLNF